MLKIVLMYWKWGVFINTVVDPSVRKKGKGDREFGED